jgi:signal transduction histidine kinase
MTSPPGAPLNLPLPRDIDLFTQEESSLDRSQVGPGLGLPLVKELVALHGGTVQVRSEGRGKGSEFTVRLPLRRTSPDRLDICPMPGQGEGPVP